jgi:glycerol-3-phosphate cytidylyltransferase-like family protein
MARFKQALTFGRFNLLHRGHIDLFDQMFVDAPDVVIGLSTGSKNLQWSKRRQVIDKALEGRNYQVLPKPSPFSLFEVRMYDPQDTVIYLGQDQWELGQTLSREFGVASVTIPRLTSSTSIRALIDNEEWSLLAKEVPANIIHDVTLLRKLECQNSL